jgi:hypothetical protein
MSKYLYILPQPNFKRRSFPRMESFIKFSEELTYRHLCLLEADLSMPQIGHVAHDMKNVDTPHITRDG